MLPTTVPKNIDKYFFNRKRDISRINLQISSIFEDLPNQLLITGNRGVGKTFLLKKILQDQPDSVLTIFLDVSKIYSNNKVITEEKILKELLTSIYGSIKNDDSILKNIKRKLKYFVNNIVIKDYEFRDEVNLFNIPIPIIKDNYNELSKLVMELPQKIIDTSDKLDGFIIVIDEFQFIKYVENPQAFFWLFRSYIQDQSNVCYIFTGSVSKTADIIEDLNGQSGAFAGRMIQIDIEPFTKDETKQYIEEKAGGIQFTSDGFERFYKCTRGIPAYINTFCNVLDTNKLYDEEMIKESFIMQMDQIVIIWLYVWGNLNDYEKAIIKIIIDNGELTWNELLAKTSFSKSTLTKYIESLNNKAILRYTNANNYALNDKMLETWLKHKKETEGQYPT